MSYRRQIFPYIAQDIISIFDLEDSAATGLIRSLKNDFHRCIKFYRSMRVTFFIVFLNRHITVKSR